MPEISKKIETQEEWLRAVAKYDSHSANFESGDVFKRLYDLGLLEIESVKRERTRYLIIEDPQWRLISYSSDGKRYALSVEPGQLAMLLAEDKISFDQYMKLYWGVLWQSKRYNDNRFNLKVSERKIWIKIYKWLDAHPEVDIEHIKNADIVQMAKDMNTTLKTMLKYWIMYVVTSSGLSIDSVAENGEGAPIEHELEDINASTPLDDMIEETFLQKLDNAYQAFTGKNGHCKPALKCLLTWFLAGLLAASNRFFFVLDYMNTCKKLALCAENGDDVCAILGKKQESKHKDAPRIIVAGQEFDACCQAKEMFDTLIACWLFAKGDLVMTDTGNLNKTEYFRVLTEAYAAAKRGRAPSPDALGRPAILGHIDSIIKVFVGQAVS